MKPIQDLGCTTNAEVIAQLVSIDGKFVIDAGCGSMVFTRLLSEQGARVLAVDPDAVQAELNRTAEPIPNVEFVECSAATLPVEDGSVDGVFFSYSLHHIPAAIYPQVFDEVLRVLRPDGFIYVIEPLDCPLNNVMKLFHNEDAERASAWQSLEDLSAAFESSRVVTYHGFSSYESFEEFAQHFSSRSFNELYTEADVRRAEVKNAFAQHAGPDNRFKSPRNVMMLKNPTAKSPKA